MATRVYERIVQQDLDTGTGSATITNPGGGSLTGTQVNLSTFAVTQLAVTGTWNPASVAAGSKVSTTLTVTGASLGDLALASFSLDIQELQLNATVSASNTVEVTLYNLTGAAVDLSSGTLKVLVFSVKS